MTSLPKEIQTYLQTTNNQEQAKPLEKKDLPLHDMLFINEYQIASVRAAHEGVYSFMHDGKVYIVGSNKEQGTAIYGGLTIDEIKSKMNQ